jgi:hypothetical protein
MLGSSWVAAQLAASQEGLSSMNEWAMKTNFKADAKLKGVCIAHNVYASEN